MGLFTDVRVRNNSTDLNLFYFRYVKNKKIIKNICMHRNKFIV